MRSAFLRVMMPAIWKTRSSPSGAQCGFAAG
jgi:hypothetical protein